MEPLELRIVRRVLTPETESEEGFSLGRLFNGETPVCYTVEDQDRRLEEGNGKLYGRTAMPLGRYELVLYNSPKHGTVPLFKGVPGFTYTEIHKANWAKELLGCVGVGMSPTATGVANCPPALRAVVELMREAQIAERRVFCTIERAT